MATNGSTGEAYVDPAAFVPSEATVHAGAIGPGVHLSAGVVVGPGAVLGFPAADGHTGPLRVGEKTWIGSGVCIEPDVEIGAESRIEFGTRIRSGANLGKGVVLGSGCTVMGPCRIADFASLLANVHVCCGAVLEESCQLMPGVILLNELYPPTGLDVRGPTIGRCAVVGVNTLIYPGVRLGFHAMAASMSEVRRDVADYSLVRGRPAEPVCDVREIRTKVGDQWVFPYPWMRHHVDGEDITPPVPIWRR